MIAEPWDLGPDGYQLGNFPRNFLEWNDRYRDDVRRFWRGDRSTVGTLATRLAGSSDIFAIQSQKATRSVNFIAAHDGMTLADMLRYERKHNEANGEDNRDGHNENLSWNHGVEGETSDPSVAERRQRDARALLATLFMSRGTIMLTAGDEFGRTQGGNNNAYAQDNEITWLNWAGRDRDLEAFAAALAEVRKSVPALMRRTFLTGEIPTDGVDADVAWLGETGAPLTERQWQEPERHRLTMLLGNGAQATGRLAVIVNGDRRATTFSLPVREGQTWRAIGGLAGDIGFGQVTLPGRTVLLAREMDGSTEKPN